MSTMGSRTGAKIDRDRTVSGEYLPFIVGIQCFNLCDVLQDWNHGHIPASDFSQKHLGICRFRAGIKFVRPEPDMDWKFPSRTEPPTEPLVATLQGTEYDTGLDLNLLTEISEYFKPLREQIKV